MGALLFSAVALLAGQAPSPQAIHKEIADSLGKHKTVVGTAIVSNAGETNTIKFKLLKPNYFVLSSEKTSQWCDGEQNFMRFDGMDTPHCTPASKDSIDAPYLRGFEGFTKNPNSKLKPISMKAAKFEGQTSRALTYEQPETDSDAGRSPKLAVTIYFHETKPFPLGWTAKGGSFDLNVVYKDLAFDKELSKSEFKLGAS